MCHRISTSEAEMQPARAAYVRFRTCTAKVTPIPTRRGACSTTYFRREGLFDPVSIVLALKRPERIQAISLRLMGGDSQCNARRERIERCGSIHFLSLRSPLCDSSDFTRRPEAFQNVFKTNTVHRSAYYPPDEIFKAGKKQRMVWDPCFPLWMTHFVLRIERAALAKIIFISLFGSTLFW